MAQVGSVVGQCDHVERGMFVGVLESTDRTRRGSLVHDPSLRLCPRGLFLDRDGLFCDAV